MSQINMGLHARIIKNDFLRLFGMLPVEKPEENIDTPPTYRYYPYLEIPSTETRALAKMHTGIMFELYKENLEKGHIYSLR